MPVCTLKSSLIRGMIITHRRDYPRIFSNPFPTQAAGPAPGNYSTSDSISGEPLQEIPSSGAPAAMSPSRRLAQEGAPEKTTGVPSRTDWARVTPERTSAVWITRDDSRVTGAVIPAMAMVLQSTGIPKDVYSIMAARVLQSQASGGAVPSRLMQGGRSRPRP